MNFDHLCQRNVCNASGEAKKVEKKAGEWWGRRYAMERFGSQSGENWTGRGRRGALLFQQHLQLLGQERLVDGALESERRRIFNNGVIGITAGDIGHNIRIYLNEPG